MLKQWLLLQQDKPEDFVIATGQTHEVREFVTLAFKEVGIDIKWQGEGIDEKGLDELTGRVCLLKLIRIISVQPRWNCFLAMQRKHSRNWAGSRKRHWKSSEQDGA
jgi:GDP-D-mannose dehydratase